MRVLGLHLLKGQLRFGVLEGTKAQPTLVGKGRLITPSPDDVPALMDWYDSQFRQLIASHHPEKLTYRLTLAPKKDQLFSSEFPLGVLNLIAHQSSLPIVGFTPQSYTASRLGLSRGADIYKHCDSTLGKHPPYWDKSQKDAILAAWFEV